MRFHMCSENSAASEHLCCVFNLLCPALSFCALIYLNFWASWIMIRVHVQDDTKEERVGAIMVLVLLSVS